MTIVKLIGGMGNQMFQYGFGKYLEKIKKNKVFYDNERFEDKEIISRRTYQLGCFKIKGRFVNKMTSYFFKMINEINERKILSLPIYIKENGVGTDSRINNCVYLDGYWQNYSYIKVIEKYLKEDFIFIQKTSKRNNDFIDTNINVNTVSLHIRRGDYISDESVNKLIGTCSLSYYKKAVAYILKKINKPKFIIFSDDINWCKRNLVIENAKYIDWNKGNNSWQDMYLMSKCKHNIIANSSFSWWGAWLNNNPQKIVIAPKRWFKDKEAQKNAANLIPSAWLKL
jgi:hypothetical protein